MKGFSENLAPMAEFRRVTEMLGGDKVLGSTPRDALGAHEMIDRGLPGQALDFLVGHLETLNWASGSLDKALGMSLRTMQRRKDAPTKKLSQEQSGRTWKFAEILAKATSIFGSQKDAEEWLERPAIGLEQRRPIDLLTTPTGIEIVESFLERIAYGVYA